MAPIAGTKGSVSHTKAALRGAEACNPMEARRLWFATAGLPNYGRFSDMSDTHDSGADWLRPSSHAGSSTAIGAESQEKRTPAEANAATADVMAQGGAQQGAGKAASRLVTQL